VSETPTVDRPSPGSPYDMGLDRGPANYVPLTPLSFLDRAATVYPQRTAIVYGERRMDYAAFRERCRRLAAALAAAGVGRGDTVSALLPNIPEMLECHYGVPMCGAVLNAVNTRLDAASVAFFLRHAESKVFIVDRGFADVTRAAFAELDTPPLLVEVDDPAHGGESVGGTDYESFLADDAEAFVVVPPEDEWQAIALNYTSGTTGDPKGVVYHHRGAYLNALSNVLATELTRDSVYLWTLPMFHCNGWTFPWSVTAVAATHVCLREVLPEAVFAVVAKEKVTMFCGAPVVLTMLLHAPDEQRHDFSHRCAAFTGGAAPPSAVIEGMERLGFTVTQLYGLTETYGPSMVSAWQDEWADLELGERARLMARQGHGYPLVEGVRVADPDSGADVPADGETVGEILIRANTVMKGYLKNPKSTAEAFRDGWFHSGDLAVLHADGTVEVKDRSKDIIISGGENISSLEVEEALYRHPAVMEAAVVARPDAKWGETPCAFVTLAEGAGAVAEADIIAFCRDNMARYKAPKTVVFGPLPKTSTGKIMKYELRTRARGLTQ
jgi:fatty-acyl-CoA synthase